MKYKFVDELREGCIKYAKKKCKEVINIDPVSLEIKEI